MKNLVKMMTVVVVMVAMVFVFTGCGSVNVTGTYNVDDIYGYDYNGDYIEMMNHHETEVVAEYWGIETINITDDLVVLGNGMSFAYELVDEGDGLYTISTSNGKLDITFYTEDNTISVAMEDGDIWYNPAQ